jgi:hypothetical protein
MRSSSSHTPPPSTYAGVKCEHTTRSSFIHAVNDPSPIPGSAQLQQQTQTAAFANMRLENKPAHRQQQTCFNEERQQQAHKIL